ncbi:MAG: hypothetical protein JST40_09095 [Armatimonadetes bacterium]|nr:hypothetical protein [Armatimonadota bacterium]
MQNQYEADTDSNPQIGHYAYSFSFETEFSEYETLDVLDEAVDKWTFSNSTSFAQGFYTDNTSCVLVDSSGSAISSDASSMTMNGPWESGTFSSRSSSFGGQDVTIHGGQVLAVNGVYMPAPGVLRGDVTFNGWGASYSARQVDVILVDPSNKATTFAAVTLLGSGTFAIQTNLGGTQRVFVKSEGHLMQFAGTVNLDSAGSVVAPSLTPGDIDGDNVTSVFDYLLLSEAFDTTVGDAKYRPAADLDGDQTITVFDYLLFSTYFDLVGDEPL